MSKTQYHRLWLVLAPLAVALGGGFACRPSQAPVAQTLVFARGADSQKLDPHDVDDGESMKVLVNICEGLVRFRSGSTEVEPCLATRWEISPDGLTYTFTLRDGVTFHDGTPLDAPAAAFSFLRQLDPHHPAHLPEAAFQYWSAMFNMVATIDVVDPQTLRFRLTEPHAPFLSSLAIPAASLISPRFRDQRTPVGTGPFRFVSWTPNEQIVLAANATYWDGAPALEKLVFKVVPDNATRLIQLQTGQVQGLDGLDPHDRSLVEQDSSLQLLTAPGLNVCYLSFNAQQAPLDNPALRRALAAAINKTDIIKSVYRDAALIAKNPLPPFVPGHNDQTPATLPRSVPPATGRPLTLHVMTNPRPYLPNPIRAAELIKADLEQLPGVTIEIVPNEWGAHLTRTQRGEHDLALLGWVGDNGDADNFLYVLLDPTTAIVGSALNISFWKHDPYHQLLAQARRETDAPQRAALYRQAQELIVAEAPLVPLAHAQNMVALRANVSGVLLQPNGDVLFHHARVSAGVTNH